MNSRLTATTYQGICQFMNVRKNQGIIGSKNKDIPRILGQPIKSKKKKTVPSDRLPLRVTGIILAKRKIRKSVCLCEGYIAMNTLKIASGQKLFFF